MAKKSLTINEVKKLKTKLESDILKLVKTFEKDTGVKASYINFERTNEDYDAPVKMEERGPIKDVSISMELDLLY